MYKGTAGRDTHVHGFGFIRILIHGVGTLNGVAATGRRGDLKCFGIIENFLRDEHGRACPCGQDVVRVFKALDHILTVSGIADVPCHAVAQRCLGSCFQLNAEEVVLLLGQKGLGLVVIDVVNTRLDVADIRTLGCNVFVEAPDLILVVLFQGLKRHAGIGAGQ